MSLKVITPKKKRSLYMFRLLIDAMTQAISKHKNRLTESLAKSLASVTIKFAYD